MKAAFCRVLSCPSAAVGEVTCSLVMRLKALMKHAEMDQSFLIPDGMWVPEVVACLASKGRLNYTLDPLWY